MPARDPSKFAGLLPSGARLLLVPGLVISLAIVLHGYQDVGDGFSAGVIAALVVLLQGLAFGADELDRMLLSRIAPILAFVGLFLSLLTAFIPLMLGDPLFTHRPGINEDVIHFGVLEFITPVVFDIGIYLLVYGFCVGALHAIAREEVRHSRVRRRTRKPGTPQEQQSLVEQPEETPTP